MEFASTLNEILLKGSLDFAFVDSFRMDRRIQTDPVYDEVLELCIEEHGFDPADAPRFVGIQQVEVDA